MTNSTEDEEWNLSRDVQNKSDIEIVYKINLPSQFVNGIISFLTILFNSILIICVRSHRRKLPEVVRHQLISLGTSDLIAGISPGLWCFTLVPTINENSRICIMLHLTFSISQYATLLNLCHLSARRWKVLSKSSQAAVRPTSRVPLVFLFTSLAWLTSILCHLPCLAGFTTKLNVNGCFSLELFENPDTYLYIVPLFALTLLALDIFYIHSLVILRKIKTRVSPEGSSVDNRRQISSKSGESVLPAFGIPKVSQHRDSPVRDTRISRPKSLVKENPQRGCSSRQETSQLKINTELEYQNRKTHHSGDKQEPKNSLFKDNTPKFQGAAQNETESRISEERAKVQPRQTRTAVQQTFQSNHHRLQQKAFSHLLAALIVTNLSTLPNIGIMLSVLTGNIQFEPENVPVLDMQILSLNSLINPLIYGIIVKEVRIAVKENFIKLGHCFH